MRRSATNTDAYRVVMVTSMWWARAWVVLAPIAVVVVAAACAPAPAPPTAQPTVVSPLPSPSASARVETVAPTAATTPSPVGRLASGGAVALLSRDSSTISVVDAGGDTV